MGADYFVIRGCGLQTRLGAEGFVAAMKRRVQVAALEALRPKLEEQTGKPLEELTINFGGTGQEPQALVFREVRAQAEAISDTSECEACPVAGGRELGCYCYVTYPIEEGFERLFFDYFVEALTSSDPSWVIGEDREGHGFSAAGLVKQMVVDSIPEQGTSWHEQRGSAEEGGLAEAARPVEAVLPSGETLDSARVLAAAFAPVLDGPEALMLYAHLFAGFVSYLERGEPPGETPNLAEAAGLAELLGAAASVAREGDEVRVIVAS